MQTAGSADAAVPLAQKPRIQHILDEVDEPVLGLNYVTEVVNSNPSIEAHYECSLCPSRCDPRTVVEHIIGVKHRLKYLEKNYPEFHAAAKEKPMKKFELKSLVATYAEAIHKAELRSHIVVKMEMDPSCYDGEAMDTDSGLLGGKAHLQGLIDATSEPIVGIQFVIELVNTNSNVDARYECRLCSSKCDVGTIMEHIVGMKHRLKYLEKNHTKFYNMVKAKPQKKQELTRTVKSFSDDVMKLENRQSMNVKMEVNPNYTPSVKPAPSAPKAEAISMSDFKRSAESAGLPTSFGGNKIYPEPKRRETDDNSHRGRGGRGGDRGGRGSDRGRRVSRFDQSNDFQDGARHNDHGDSGPRGRGRGRGGPIGGPRGGPRGGRGGPPRGGYGGDFDPGFEGGFDGGYDGGYEEHFDGGFDDGFDGGRFGDAFVDLPPPPGMRGGRGRGRFQNLHGGRDSGRNGLMGDFGGPPVGSPPVPISLLDSIRQLADYGPDTFPANAPVPLLGPPLGPPRGPPRGGRMRGAPRDFNPRGGPRGRFAQDGPREFPPGDGLMGDYPGDNPSNFKLRAMGNRGEGSDTKPKDVMSALRDLHTMFETKECLLKNDDDASIALMVTNSLSQALMKFQVTKTKTK